MRRQGPLPKRVGPTESELHLSVASLLDWVLTWPAMYSTFPSGWGVLTPSMAQRLKRSGLKAGMPDMLVFPGLGRCFGIELKAGKNGLSDVQRDTFEQLRSAGIPVYTCRTIDAVVNVLTNENVPMKSFVGGPSWLRKHSAPLLEEISAKRVAAGEGEGDGERKAT